MEEATSRRLAAPATRTWMSEPLLHFDAGHYVVQRDVATVRNLIRSEGTP